MIQLRINGQPIGVAEGSTTMEEVLATTPPLV